VLNGETNDMPRVAVVLIGINDLSPGATVAQTTAGIIADVTAIRAMSPGTKVLLLGILPPGGQAAGSPLLTKIQQTNANVAQWAAVHGVAFQDDGGLVSGNVDISGHPTPAGYQILANAIGGTLTALMA
jgi:lysophospholipase L1-like esterase